MHSEKTLRRLVHCRDVQQSMGPPDPPLEHTRPYSAIQQHVPVATGQGTEAGMKVVVHHHSPQHTNASWCVTVDAPHPSLKRPVSGRIEMGHLCRRVYARICPTCTDELDRLACNRGKRRFQYVLHGSPVGLCLPPLERVPRILDPYRHPHRKIPHTPSMITVPTAAQSHQAIATRCSTKTSSLRWERATSNALHPPGGDASA